jgi:hypothetical protein
MDGLLAPGGHAPGLPGATTLPRRRRSCTTAITDRGRIFAMNTLDALDAQTLRSDIPAFRPGDTLKVHVKVIEGNRSRSRCSRAW